MRWLWLGKAGALAAFLVIATLIAGGLGWVTAAVLRLEGEQWQARADRERMQRLHVALWRLDGRIAPALAREDSRPYNHYSAVFAPSVALRGNGLTCAPGTVLQPSPLLSADLPDWMMLHFQASVEESWQSPQVLGQVLRRMLVHSGSAVPVPNVTDERRLLLERLQKEYSPQVVLGATRAAGAVAEVRDTTLVPAAGGPRPQDNLNNDLAPGQTLNQAYLPPPVAQGGQGVGQLPGQVPGPQQPDAQAAGMQQQAFPQVANQAAYPFNNSLVNPTGPGGKGEYQSRAGLAARVSREFTAPQLKELPDVALNNTRLNGENWISPGKASIRGEQVDVHLSPLVPLWLSDGEAGPRLVLARLVQIENREICQGIVLDWPRLQQVLADEIADLFPHARFEPVLPGMESDPERTMLTVRAQLDPGPPADEAAPPRWTPLRAGLALAWAAAGLALLVVGLGERSLLDLSQRRIRFVSAVTHELRTPLTTLRLYLDMLTGGLVKDEAKREEYLHTLNDETDRLNRLVGNVLDFSRLENQRPRLQRSTVTVGDLLGMLQATWQKRCQDAGKELVVESALPPETLVNTDTALVQQVLGNLLDNACKYSRGAADPAVRVRARREGRRLVLEVEDRGPGVPPGERRSVFRAFRRGREADVTVGGVGLGLALAQRWAALLGGRLSLASDRAVGACFRLELPMD